MEPNNLNSVATEIMVDGKSCDYITMSLRQSMTGHHVFEIAVSFRHDKPSVWEDTADEIIRQNLGKQVSINMRHIDTGDTNEFTGVVTDVEIVGLNGDKGTVVLHGGSPTLILDRDPAMDSFTDYNLRNIVEETIEKTGVKVELRNNPESDAVIPYVARHKETTYGFLSRILSTYGEWFYYDGRCLVVGNPHDTESSDVSYDIELSEVRIRTGLRNLNVELYDYNPSTNEYLEDVPPQSIEGINLYMQAAEEASSPYYPETVKLPAGYQVQGEKDIMSAIRTHYSRNYSRTSTFTAVCKTCAIQVGKMATATIPNSFENVSFRDLGRFRILDVHHTVDRDGHYKNIFTGIAGLTEALPADHIVKPSAFPEPATVVSNDDPLRQGRVQVRYMWQPEDKTTNWIRVQTPDAGNASDNAKNRGFVFIPEVDDQVMVGFQYGDPNRPYVMGSLFHKDSSEGAAPDNTVKSIITRSGIKIVANDQQRSLHIEDPSGNTWDMDGNGNISVYAVETMSLTAKNMHVEIEENITVNAGKDVRESVGGNCSLSVAESLSAGVDKNINISAKKDIGIKTDSCLNMTAKKDIDTQAKGDVVIETSSGEMQLASKGNLYIKSDSKVHNAN